MARLPESVISAWQGREGPIVLSTVSPDGIPNAIYATCVALHEGESIIVANNYFEKTMRNIAKGSQASVLFITKEGKSFQLKGSVDYHTEGAIYQAMKSWNPTEHPGHGAVMVKIGEAFSGAERLM